MVIGDLGRNRQFERRHFRIGFALLLGGIETGILNRIGGARTQAPDRVEARRIENVGGDVGNRRQLVGLVAKIGRVGEKQPADRDRSDRIAEPAQALPPDRDQG